MTERTPLSTLTSNDQNALRTQNMPSDAKENINPFSNFVSSFKKRKLAAEEPVSKKRKTSPEENDNFVKENEKFSADFEMGCTPQKKKETKTTKRTATTRTRVTTRSTTSRNNTSSLNQSIMQRRNATFQRIQAKKQEEEAKLEQQRLAARQKTVKKTTTSKTTSRVNSSRVNSSRVNASMMVTSLRSSSTVHRPNTLNTTIASHTVGKYDIKGRLEAATLEVSNLKQENESLKIQLEEVTQQLSEALPYKQEALLLREQLSKIREEKTKLEAEKRRDEIDLLSYKEMNKRYEQESIDLKVQNKTLETQLRQERMERTMEIANMKTNYETELRQLREEKTLEVQAAKEEAKAELFKVKSELNKELRDIRNKLETTKIDLDYSESESKQKSEKIQELEKIIQEKEERIKQLEEQANKDEMLRRKLHNTIQELKGNIRVYCRVRPILKGEDNSYPIEQHIKFSSDPQTGEQRGIEVISQPQSSATGLVERSQRYQFQFDRVFDPSATQDAVFVEISQLVQSALDGYKVCIFAYGQTGSGKTFTMEGPAGGLSSPEHKGMIQRSVEQIFKTAKYMQTQGWRYQLQASFLEIYNEEIRDLLNPKPAPNTEYEIRTDSLGETTVTNLIYVDVDDSERVYELLKIASKNRAVGVTNCNERSSRSHSVFTLKITGTHRASGQVARGVLNLIDLAGSERLEVSKSTGDRLKETCHINKSLACLGDVINALATKAKHVPFRNSTLTKLLQNSLGGDSKTLMFVNISPVYASHKETICSLRFASKVNSCEIGTARKRTQNLNTFKQLNTSISVTKSSSSKLNTSMWK